MPRPKVRNLPDLSHLAVDGSELSVRATPRAARDDLRLQDGHIRITVRAVPENGRANAAVQAILAAALKVAPTDLTLTRGHTARTKTFRYDGSSRS